jgi:hypothetical protein
MSLLYTAVGALLLWLDPRVAFLYAFFMLACLIHDAYENLRVMARVFSHTSESKILAVARKVGVTEADIQTVIEEARRMVPYDRWESLQEDMRRIIKGA